MFASNRENTVSPEEIGFEFETMRKIFVKPPYNRLYDLAPYGARGVLAHVRLESPNRFEFGGPSSAELGRHMAIAGSLALARNNTRPGPFYYLAKQARISRINRSISFDKKGGCSLVALPRDDGSVDVLAKSLSSGLEMAKLHCRYQKLSPRLFDRLFSAHKTRTPKAAESPYTREQSWESVEFDTVWAKAQCPKVCAEMCAGHFTDYPALPVAMLMDGINRLTCEHLIRRHEAPGIVIGGNIEANRLAFTGECLEFSVEQGETQGNQFLYNGVVRNLDGEVFARSRILYETRKPDGRARERETI